MRGDAEVLALLNEQLTSELTAIHQFQLHANMQANWGYLKLASKTCEDIAEEQGHAEKLTRRILTLEGKPDYQRLFTLRTGSTVSDQMRAAQALELEVVDRLQPGIGMCTAKGDYASARLLSEILAEEEEHVDYLETQLNLISTLGEQLYLSMQI